MTHGLTQRILVVEDEALVAMDISETLKSLGYNVVTVAHAGEGRVMPPADFDAVLLDHGISGEDSEAFADELLARGTPFAFCTGLFSEELRQRYPDVPLLEKPFQPEELRRLVETFFP